MKKDRFQNTKITLLISTYNWKEALSLVLLSAARQTVFPHEIIIADDGSTSDTKETIDGLRSRIPIPIKHIWHEDQGFRKCTILNKALAYAEGDYIIEIDGDIVMEEHFIEDHLELMEHGYYVCGSRTKLLPQSTDRLLQGTSPTVKIRDMKLGDMLNSLRSKFARRFLSKRYGQRLDHMRGCNFAFWRSDFIRVNGYNEDFVGWGYEDSELVFRMHFAGCKKKFLKMGGVGYHLYHPEVSRNRATENKKKMNEAFKKCSQRCLNGIDQYLL